MHSTSTHQCTHQIAHNIYNLLLRLHTSHVQGQAARKVTFRAHACKILALLATLVHIFILSVGQARDCQIYGGGIGGRGGAGGEGGGEGGGNGIVGGEGGSDAAHQQGQMRDTFESVHMLAMKASRMEPHCPPNRNAV